MSEVRDFFDTKHAVAQFLPFFKPYISSLQSHD